jgi:hypothetical protein
MNRTSAEISINERIEATAHNENRHYRKLAAALYVGGLASAAALGLTASEIHIDNPGIKQIVDSLETAVTSGGLLIGTIYGLKAHEMHKARIKAITRLSFLRFGIPEN